MDETSPENTTLENQSSGVKMAKISKTEKQSDASISDNGIFSDSSTSGVDNWSIPSLVTDLHENDTKMTEGLKTNQAGGSFIAEAEVLVEAIPYITSSTTFGNILETIQMQGNTIGENKESETSQLEQSKDSSLPGNGAAAGHLTVGEAINCPVKKKTTVKGVKKAVSMRSRAPAMVSESLKDFDKRNGATFDELISHIDEKYGIHSVVIKRRISQFLQQGEKRGEIEKVIGVNKETRFKIKQKENSE